MKKVCIIYTGGTIGMKRTENGYSPVKGFLKGALEEVKELHYPGVPKFDLIEYDPLLDSSNIAVEEWMKIAKDIFRLYDEYDGFVVLHGTDTMAYTASALSFSLQGLDKPVVLTGSQIPLEEIRSDALDNIVTSIIIAGDGKVPEVCLYFNNYLFRGNRVMKVSSDEKGAFESPNYPELAESGIHIRYRKRNIKKFGDELKFYEIKPKNVIVLKLVPGFSYRTFAKVLGPDVDAVIFEGFGAGNLPNNKSGLDEFLRVAEEYNTNILICTQCQRGTTILGEYETSSELKRAGAISCYNMTTEAIIAKLYYLLSQGYTGKSLKKEMEKNIVGEVNV